MEPYLTGWVGDRRSLFAGTLIIKAGRRSPASNLRGWPVSYDLQPLHQINHPVSDLLAM
jgi:hypothetical protein